MDTSKEAVIVLLCAAVIAGLASVGAAADKKPKSEEEIGIRQETLYDEGAVKPAHGEYGKAGPGSSTPIGRAFENSPPLIPHDLTGMLPIAQTNNSCLGCHMPDAAEAMGATALPKSHFYDIRTGRDLKGELDGKRFDCMQCHVPQVSIPEPIRNTFKADFRTKKAKTSSNLLENLNEGVRAE